MENRNGTNGLLNNRFCVKYRPTKVEDIIERDGIEWLDGVMQDTSDKNVVIIGGKSGSGKTTLARIMMNRYKELHGEDTRVLEYDYLFVDVKQLTNNDTINLIIVDDCDLLTRSCQFNIAEYIKEANHKIMAIIVSNSIKSLEPELSKLSNCYIDLDKVSDTVIKNRLEEVSKLEEMHISDKQLDDIVGESNGNMRYALDSLQNKNMA